MRDISSDLHHGLPAAPNTAMIRSTRGYIWCSRTAYGVFLAPLAIIQGSHTHMCLCLALTNSCLWASDKKTSSLLCDNAVAPDSHLFTYCNINIIVHKYFKVAPYPVIGCVTLLCSPVPCLTVG